MSRLSTTLIQPLFLCVPSTPKDLAARMQGAPSAGDIAAAAHAFPAGENP